MPSGDTHENSYRILGFLLAPLAYLNGYSLAFSIYLFIGASILSLYFSDDLDSPKSKPTQRWGPLKGIWRPFVDAGHREVLHHWLWGPTILSIIPALLMLPYIWKTQDFEPIGMIIGLIAATELHILFDHCSSFWNGIKKFSLIRWILNKLNPLRKKRGYRS